MKSLALGHMANKQSQDPAQAGLTWSPWFQLAHHAAVFIPLAPVLSPQKLVFFRTCLF